MGFANINGFNTDQAAGSGPREALLLIDLITDFEFEDGEQLYRSTRKIIPAVAELKRRAKRAGLPVIYVNDEFDETDGEVCSLIRHVRSSSEQGSEILSYIEPDDDYFVAKPQRSGFYATSLGVLLLSMGVSKIVIAGVTTDICVLFTAHDAYMRGYEVAVPKDTSTAVRSEFHNDGIKLIERVADADISPAKDLEFETRGTNLGDDLIVSRYQIGGTAFAAPSGA